MKNIWKGNKVRLRAVEMSDLEDYYLRDNELDTDAQRTGHRVLFPLGKEMMKKRVESLATIDPTGDEFTMIIDDLEGNAVGNINTHSCSRINGTFQYGLNIKDKYRIRGYASEAIKLVLRFYFLELGYQKVEARIYSFNESSIKLHEKLGYMLEGKLRRHHYALGKYNDVICYGMTKEEFFKNHKEYSMN